MRACARVRGAGAGEDNGLDVINVYNVCDLLNLAADCNARQFRDVCVVVLCLLLNLL